jgi:HAE1 family hydrophobic/amphiphilic exporter-1
MNISATFIRKPIATSLLMAAILLLGLLGYDLLPVAALPNIDTPTVLVTAQFPGADAQTIAGTVTTPLERQFGQIPGLTQMTSSSGNESSEITLQFDRSVPVDTAAQAVQAAINAAAGFLPPMPSPPIYRLTNPADTPVLMLALTSETLPLTTVSDYANSILAQKISQMRGVGSSASVASKTRRSGCRSTRRCWLEWASTWKRCERCCPRRRSTSPKAPCTAPIRLSRCRPTTS